MAIVGFIYFGSKKFFPPKILENRFFSVDLTIRIYDNKKVIECPEWAYVYC